MDVKHIISKIINAWDHINDSIQDLICGINTQKQMESTSFETFSESLQHAKKYQATRYCTLRKIRSSLNIDFGKYRFIDFGSGKGRVVIAASKWGLKNVTGVEFAKNLHLSAKNNLEQFLSRSKKSTAPITFIHLDAINYKIPTGPNIYFFYNPFREDVLRKVITNILENATHPSEDIFIYVNPRYGRIFDELNLKQTVSIPNMNFNKVVKITI